jgi:hypothetical protein
MAVLEVTFTYGRAVFPPTRKNSKRMEMSSAQKPGSAVMQRYCSKQQALRGLPSGSKNGRFDSSAETSPSDGDDDAKR